MVDLDKFCKNCKHYEFNLSQGILCGLTNNKPNFKDNCIDFSFDENKAAK